VLENADRHDLLQSRPTIIIAYIQERFGTELIIVTFELEQIQTMARGTRQVLTVGDFLRLKIQPHQSQKTCGN